MNYEKKIKQLNDAVVKIRYFESIDNCLYTDKWQTCPPYGFDYISNLGAFVSELRYNYISSQEIKNLIKDLSDSPDCYKSSIDYGMARYLLEIFNDTFNIPVELQSKLNFENTQGQKAWEYFYKHNDFKGFKPILKKQFELHKEIAYSLNPNENPYEVLINRTDKNYKLCDLDTIFETIKKEINTILLNYNTKYKNIDTSILNINVDKKTVITLVKELQNILKIDWNKTVMFEMNHPVCSLNGPNDSRPSTNYNELFGALLAAAHESGHAIYNYNSSNEVINAGIWGGIEGALHESQSRFYENHICRSKEFWNIFYPILQKNIPKFDSISCEDILVALNKPYPCLKRLSADELTSSLHIIIRYEIERDYFEDKISIDEIEEVWNEKYKEYLGVSPTSPKEGILQDVHWASGCIGYFQSYLLGDVYASQFRNKLMIDRPNCFKLLNSGDISEINEWLKNNLHSYGQVYDVQDTIKKATEETLNVNYYINYLKDKFL